MEKPRDEIRSVMHECFNRVDRIMAKSTWLEGELPTVDDIEYILVNHYWDTFEPDRLIIEKHCRFLSQAIHAILKRKLTGKE